MNDLNIVIPMAGKGSRFQKDRYLDPKPLIEIQGLPMISWAIKTLGLEGKWWFIVRNNAYKDKTVSAIQQVLKHANFIYVDTETAGPACSAALTEHYIDKQSPLCIANCDQIMTWNPQAFLHTAQLYDGCIVTYYNDSNKNSFARTTNFGLVTEVKEKQVISDISLNGIHWWKHSAYFYDSVVTMIQANDTAPNGEYYIGPSYNYMIKKGLTVGIHHIPNSWHNAVGVPEDLDLFLEKQKNANI
jgi:dTDP-glucose pyrophosphorylase